MGTLYTSQAASGYAASPPPDDGSQTASNQITWGTSIKGKLTDPIKVLADAINSQLTTVLDLSPRLVSAPDSAVATDHWRTLQVTGTTTITLSDAATMTNKYVVGIANLGVGTVTVTRATAGNTINGTAADFTLLPKQAVVLGVNQGANGYNILSASNASGAGIQSLIAATIDSGTTGSLSLKTNNGTEQVRITNVVSGVNRIELQGGSTGNGVRIDSQGSDTDVPFLIAIKGAGQLQINTNSQVSPATQFQVLHTAGATRNITITGSTTNPTLSTTGGSLAITPTIVAGASLGLGGTAPAGGGTGIQFPATQSASTDVNNLDDYEEGTFTPSVGGSATYTTQAARYTKVGQLVTFQITLVINAIGTGSATTISGLPFANNASVEGAASVTFLQNSATNVVSISGLIQKSASTIALRSFTVAAANDASNNILQNATSITLQGSYTV